MCRKLITRKTFSSLREAQRECVKDDRCDSIYGTMGNYFEHKTFKLCHVNSTYDTIKYTNRDDDFEPSLPPALYKRPGKFKCRFLCENGVI